MLAFVKAKNDLPGYFMSTIIWDTPVTELCIRGLTAHALTVTDYSVLSVSNNTGLLYHKAVQFHEKLAQHIVNGLIFTVKDNRIIQIQEKKTNNI